MSNEEELISDFKDVTGESDDDRARFYLESSNWVIQLAVSSFYEAQPDANFSFDSIDQQHFQDILDVSTGAASTERERGISSEERKNLDTPSSIGFQSISSDCKNMSKNTKSNSSQKKSSNRPRIATLHNMSQRSSDDEEEGQAFYAGGSERSGQQVLGPPRRRNFREQLTEMFRMAHESGAVVDPSNRHSHASTSSSGNDFYQGAGLRLGQTENDHSVVCSGDNDRPVRPQNIEPVKIKMWSNGFSVNDGDLRRYDHPDNKEFLDAVMTGKVPPELRQMGNRVSVDVEDHSHEEFKKETSTSVGTFKGSGRTLGSPAPNVEEVSPPHVVSGAPSVVVPPSSADVNRENEEKAAEELGLQADQPTTMLQIRLADGSRISGRFNLTHTIDDIRRYVLTSRPSYESQSFVLVTAFPTKELSDGSQTIQQAGLLNASLMQRLK